MHNTKLLGHRTFNPKSFRAKVSFGSIQQPRLKFYLPKDHSQGDQGSEANFISEKFVNSHGLPVLNLTSVGFKGLVMSNADGRRTPMVGLLDVLRPTICTRIYYLYPSQASITGDLWGTPGLWWSFPFHLDKVFSVATRQYHNRASFERDQLIPLRARV